MTILSASGLSKAYNEKILFEDISFGMESGERIGLIGRNGAGKSTLLEIICGLEFPDEGEVIFNNDVRFEYLSQEPDLDGTDTVLDSVMKARPYIYKILEEYKILCNSAKTDEDKLQLENLITKIDEEKAWNYENDAQKILSQLGVHDNYLFVSQLSGGLIKRAALSKVLISDPDLLVLDEPTNHLDADSVQWLQDKLMNTNKSLIFITHDRYFLDAVCTKIIEIDKNRLFSYPGNYEKYLERKEKFILAEEATVDHMKVKLRTELAWLQKGAKARRRKQKSRIDWIEVLQQLAVKKKEKKIKIELGKTFIGSRIIDAHYISRAIGEKQLFRDFTYIAKPKDRIGIIGPNGSGKSTLLKTLAGEEQPDTGKVKVGASIKIGFFRQEISDLKDNKSLLASLREIADYIDVGVGRDRYLTCKDLLNKFLFPPKQHTALIGTLSGGEKRRLALIRVLMANPNVLFLDEPTNDFDIQTLTALEEYLDDFYGTLIIVSHDRAFLDRTVEFIYAFDGKGNIKEYPGNYSAYLEKKESEAKNKTKSGNKSEPGEKKTNTSKKLSYKDQREFDFLEKEIPELEQQKEDLQNKLKSLPPEEYEKAHQISLELEELENKIMSATEKWFELGEKGN